MTKPLLNTKKIAQLEQFTQLIVGFSGGLDSTVLLHALATEPSLFKKLVAVHVNHGISPNALLWQDHCEDFCNNLGVKFITSSVEFNRSSNIEEGARKARYELFSSLLKANDCLLLGHHLDDQAETLLLQLFRGAGVDGLAAMMETSVLGLGSLVRPFLTYSRKKLEFYAVNNQLNWIEDESNQEINYSRNFLRHQVMPLLKAKWPGVVGNIARTTRHCQQARKNLDELALHDSQELLFPSSSLFIKPLKSFSYERIANVLRVWLKKNYIQLPSSATFERLIDEMIFASPDTKPIVSWDNITIRRYQEYLYIIKDKEVMLPFCLEWTEFPQPLICTEQNCQIIATKATMGIKIPREAKITIKNRQGGELFYWHGQTKQLKKLFQEWNIAPWLRDNVPLIYINEQLAGIVGYAISDLFFTKDPSKAWSLSIKN